MTELGQRFDFLLRPIKDLTKNWNVDIAAVLEDFHEELEKMTFTFDGGKTQLNFAEAAFLIQGTACVWSRKVESLHNLVYQTLEMILNSRHNKQPSSIDPQGVDTDATFDSHDDKLLNLDDIRNANNKKTFSCETDLICLALRCPFLQRSEDERGSPFVNKNGEVTNFYHDFWSNNVVPQRQGSMLLDCHFNDDMNKNVSREHVTAESDAYEVGPDNLGLKSLPIVKFALCDFRKLQQCNALIRNQMNKKSNLLIAVSNAYTSLMCKNASECSATDDAPADDFLADINDDADHSEVADGTVVKPILDEASPIDELQCDLRPRHQLNATSMKLLNSAAPAKATLDPHSSCTEWVAKLFKKGITFKYPASMKENSRKRKATPPATAISFISDFLNSARKYSADEVTFLKREKMRRNLLWKKLLPKKLERKGALDLEQEREDNNLPEDDCSMGEVDDHGLSDVDDLINDITLGGAGLENGQADDLLEHNLDSYEDLVRHHVELFYSSAKRYVQESALSQRVKDWQDSIDPFLNEQDDRPEFDIHKYGDYVINQIPSMGDEKSFGDFVNREEKWEICRHFAAVLQLANDRCIQLSSKCENVQNSVNSLRVKLLSRHRPKDKIADYVPV